MPNRFRRWVGRLRPGFVAIGLLMLSPGMGIDARSADVSLSDPAKLNDYKRRVLELIRTETDPVTRNELQRVYRLLSLMERSVALQASGVPSSGDAPLPPPSDLTPPGQGQDVPNESQRAVEAETKPPDSAPPADDSLRRGEEGQDEEPVIVQPAPSEGAQARDPAMAALSESRRLPQWYFRTRLSAGLGYQDNLLRSAFSDLSSSALLGQIDIELFKTRRREHRFAGIGRYSRTHFLDEPDVRDEDLLFILAHYEKRLIDRWWLGLRADYFRAHQPIDDVDGIDFVGSLPLSLEQFGIGPSIAWDLSDNQTWSLNGGFRREKVGSIANFEDQSNDQYWLELDYSYQPSDRHRFRAGYLVVQRDYDERQQRFPDGTVVAGSRSRVLSQRFSMDHRLTWKWGGARFRWTNGVRYIDEQGRGPGYDDFDRVELRSGLEVRWPRVELLAEIRRGHYWYDSRQVSRTDTTEVEREYWAGRIEGHYKIDDDWRLWMRYEGTDRSGNREIDRYRYHSVYAGFQWTF